MALLQISKTISVSVKIISAMHILCNVSVRSCSSIISSFPFKLAGFSCKHQSFIHYTQFSQVHTSMKHYRHKHFLVSKRKCFDEEPFLANVVWLHIHNCCKGAVACLYQEGGMTGIMFYHLKLVGLTGWAYKH